jgi:response regulator NasT
LKKWRQSLKVLLVDDNELRADAVASRLADAGVGVIVRLRSGQRLIDIVRQEAPDVVIVDMARPDRDSLDGIRQVNRQSPRAIVMFVDQDDPAFMEEAIEAGVSSYNLLGSAIPDVKPIVQSAMAIFRRYQRVSEDLSRAEAQLRERATIQTAKSILIQTRRFGEPQAHSWLRRNAMNSGKRMVDIAQALIDAEGKKAG